MFLMERATLVAFDPGSYTATVQYASSLSMAVPSVPVSRGIASGELVAGRRLAVAVFDDGPADAMVVGVW
ncbi:MAG: hypothetical protein DWG83_01515 [Chloroflexi bacterium]|nr:hypothetical protein [Chloroflexota bacterium]